MVNSNTTFVDTTGLTKSPYGILSPATTVKELPNTALSGFSYNISDAGLIVQNGPLLGTADKSVVVDNSEQSETFGFYLPFNVEASIKASTFGTSPEDLMDSARTALGAVTQKAIESEFWLGSIAQQYTRSNDNRFLSSEAALDVTPTPGSAVKVRYGQALLEQALGEAPLGAQGVIHAPRLVASVMQTSDINGGLRTNLGTHVVAGSGYSHIGPDGVLAPTDKSWMYATGPVTVHLGDINLTPEKLNQAVDSSDNTITYYVDRPAAVTWSTTHLYAVLVDLTLDYA